jgi:hypothetical protein
MPVVGGRVIVNFLGTSVPGTVSAVLEDGRRLEVTTDEGETILFALNRATATFTAQGEQTGARLSFVDLFGPQFEGGSARTAE